MRILLTGSGGGGHIIPLVAVAQELKKIAVNIGILDLEFLYLGPKIEEVFSKQLLTQEEIKIKTISAYKFRRYFSIHNFLDIFKIPYGFIKALYVLLFYLPDIVFSKGGYGSVPVVIASWLYRIPVVIHESDVVPGKANLLTSKFSKKILLAFSKSLKYFPVNKSTVVGNPVRLNLKEGNREKGLEIFNILSDKPILLITGGSQGAQKINDVILNTLPELVKKYEIIHLVGEKNYRMVSEESKIMIPKGFEEFYHIFPSLTDELKEAYAVADLIISRSGAGAIFEIALNAKPSILIPIKNSSNNHQRENAYEFEKFKGAIVTEEDNLTPHILLSLIERILSDKNVYQSMSQASYKFAAPESAELITKEILRTLKIII